MKIVNKIAAVVALVGIAAPAAAGPVIQPVPVGTETIRYF